MPVTDKATCLLDPAASARDDQDEVVYVAVKYRAFLEDWMLCQQSVEAETEDPAQQRAVVQLSCRYCTQARSSMAVLLLQHVAAACLEPTSYK